MSSDWKSYSNKNGIYWCSKFASSPKTPFSPVSKTLFLGTGIELLKGLGIVWGRGQLKFWGFLGFIPKFPRFSGLGTGTESLKTSGMLRGWGNPKYWGFFGGKSPKISEFRGGGGGKNLGDFPTTSPKLSLKKLEINPPKRSLMSANNLVGFQRNFKNFSFQHYWILIKFCKILQEFYRIL